MKSETLFDIASKYLMDDIKSSVSPGGRFANILEKLDTSGTLSNVLLDFLRDSGFYALHRLSTGEISFADYLPLAQREQNKRRVLAKNEALKAEQEHQNFMRRIREREVAEQRVRAEEERARMEKLHARKKDPRYQAKIREKELRWKYGLDAFVDRDNYPKLMKLLRNLDKGARISAEEFVWLSTPDDDNYDSYVTVEISDRYHFVEAKHFAAEFKQTGDPWHAVNASSHFRKCEQPGQADQLFRGIKIAQAKSVKLQSALCTTYGGVKRDLHQFNVALEFGLRAHELTPRDFRPCTLLGAVSYEQGNFEQGQIWYDKAVERGFTKKQVDNELKNIFLRLEENKQGDMREHLLALDQERYEWANTWGF